MVVLMIVSELVDGKANRTTYLAGGTVKLWNVRNLEYSVFFLFIFAVEFNEFRQVKANKVIYFDLLIIAR